MPENGQETDGESPGWHRPKTQLFRALSLLWCFPTLGSCLILALNWAAWSEAQSVQGALAATRLEQWIALGLLGAHPVILFLARRYDRVERPVELPPEAEEEQDGKKIQ